MAVVFVSRTPLSLQRDAGSRGQLQSDVGHLFPHLLRSFLVCVCGFKEVSVRQMEGENVCVCVADWNDKVLLQQRAGAELSLVRVNADPGQWLRSPH